MGYTENVVPQSGKIRKAQVEDLRVVLLGEFKNGLGVSHEDSLPGASPLQKSGERLRKVLQAGRLLQSVALCRTDECKACFWKWQFDCFYGGDNGTLYLSRQRSMVSAEDLVEVGATLRG